MTFMSTVGAMPTVTSELFHVPSDNVVFLVANSGNELSFSSSSVTSQPDIGFSSRFSGAHCSPHVDRFSHVASPGRGASSSWRINPWRDQSVEQAQTFTSTLEMQVAEQRQILSQQQVTLSSLTETLRSIQDDLKRKKEVRPSSGKTGNVNTKTKVDRFLPTPEMFNDDSDCESSESEGEGNDDDTLDEPLDEPPSKKGKLTDSAEKSSNDSRSKLSKLKTMFTDTIEHGPKVEENLANMVNKDISANFNIKTALEYGDNFKPPENCEFLRVPKLNEELFFEESIATQYKKNDGILQKTQQLLTKGMIPLVQLMDKALKNEEDSDIFYLATDSLQLLAYTHRDISNVRRKFLKPAVAQKYKRLCSSNIPLTASLLGDDLDKQLKAINDQKKIVVKVTIEPTRKCQYDRDFQHPSTSTSHQGNYGARSNSQSFLYRQRGNNP